MTALRFLLPLLLTALFIGCSGETARGTVPQVASARAERVVEDGAATLKSTVTVNFDRPFELATSKLPLASHFEIGVPRQGGGTKRVLVRKATQTGAGSRQVVLEVDSLVPEGSVLKVARKAFVANEAGELSAEIGSDLTPEFAILASVALMPTRAELFADPKVPAVTAADRDPVELEKLLDRHLSQRGSDAAMRERVSQNLQAIPEELVPHPKIRVALAALTGTFAEPALNSLLTASNCTQRPVALIAFQPPPGGGTLIAQVTRSGDGRRVVSLAPDLEGERFELLMPLLAHEAVHCDERAGIFEEVAATAFDTFLYMHLIAVDPTLVDMGTRLARDFNINAIAKINSGRRYPESVGILRSVGVTNVLPGTTRPVGSFGELVANAYGGVGAYESPPEPLAQEYVRLLAGAAGMQPGNAFDLRYLDELMGRALDPRVLAAAIVALDLTPER
jgi:hypothetical protein